MFVSPLNSYIETLMPGVMAYLKVGLWGKLGHEGGTFMCEISANIRNDIREMIFLSLTCEDKAEGGYLQARKIDFTRCRIFWHLELGPLASRTMRSTCLLFKLFSLWYCYRLM